MLFLCLRAPRIKYILRIILVNIFKKHRTVIATAAFFSLSIAQAGTMGSVSRPSFIPFIGGEAAYTWNQVQQLSINRFLSDDSTSGWGGRLSLGIIHPYSDRLSFTSEIGGGYYGRVKRSINASPRVTPTGTNAGVVGRSSYNIDGYEALMGAMYQYKKVDLFGKLGFMAQNLRLHKNNTITAVVPGGSLTNTVDEKQSSTQILPEIKVGGIYNMNENLGLTLAYMHVFGSSMKANGSMIGTSNSLTISKTQNNQNPTLDSIMFGLMYSFV